MIIYLNTIISCYVDETILQMSTLLSNQYIRPFVCRCKSDSDWFESINHDSNTVAAIKQIYSFNNNATYFKYAYGKDGQYQFGFPRLIIDASFMGQYGIIKLKRNNS